MDFRGPKGMLPRRRWLLAIDITPLVDVVFLLLIFFLITSTFVRDKHPAIPLTVPQSRSAQDLSEGETLIVHVSSDGSLYLDQHPLDGMGALEEAITERQEGGVGGTTLLIRADEDSRHGVVVQVMDLARRLGLEDFGIVTREE